MTPSESCLGELLMRWVRCLVLIVHGYLKGQSYWGRGRVAGLALLTYSARKKNGMIVHKLYDG